MTAVCCSLSCTMRNAVVARSGIWPDKAVSGESAQPVQPSRQPCHHCHRSWPECLICATTGFPRSEPKRCMIQRWTCIFAQTPPSNRGFFCHWMSTFAPLPSKIGWELAGESKVTSTVTCCGVQHKTGGARPDPTCLDRRSPARPGASPGRRHPPLPRTRLAGQGTWHQTRSQPVGPRTIRLTANRDPPPAKGHKSSS